jgi:uncharacterized protein YndB with AHSA1/START domain
VPDSGATRVIRAPRAAVYRALLDPEAVEQWRAPDGMTAEVLAWEPVVGGSFRITLTYDDRWREGKSSPGADTYHGTFAELVADTRVCEVVEFETAEPDMAGPMTVTTRLADADGGTRVTVTFEGIPSGVSPEDNAAGTSMSLANLADLVEGA